MEVAVVQVFDADAIAEPGKDNAGIIPTVVSLQTLAASKLRIETVPFVSSFSNQIENVLFVALGRFKQFSEFVWEAQSLTISMAIDDLSRVKGGMMDSSSGQRWWAPHRRELTSFDEVVELAARTIFKQKGISNKLRALETDIETGPSGLKSVADEHAKKRELEELSAQAAEAIKHSRATLFEAKMLQTIRRASSAMAIKDQLDLLRDELHDSPHFGESDINEHIIKKFEAMMAEAISSA